MHTTIKAAHAGPGVDETRVKFKESRLWLRTRYNSASCAAGVVQIGSVEQSGEGKSVWILVDREEALKLAQALLDKALTMPVRTEHQ